MQTFSFNHLALEVKDVASSIAFYQAVFGLGEIENTASNSKTRWLSLGEGKELHLIPRPEAELKTHKAVHFTMAAGGDFLIINLIRKEKSSALVQDHPTEAGCYIYRKIE
jgi:catechol 2,3-dioxygenase-like lactoylglutathione lyase family enzyme